MITANQAPTPAPIESNTKQPQPAPAKSAAKRKNTSSKRTFAPSTSKPAQKGQTAPRPQSKQDRVVMMLRRSEGATVAAVMKATGWQKHSVHGFFAGVVRKKLGLKLVSADRDGKRIYRIVDGKGGKHDKVAAPSRKRAA